MRAIRGRLQWPFSGLAVLMLFVLVSPGQAQERMRVGLTSLAPTTLPVVLLPTSFF
jgi:hypothetical protein